MLDFGCQKINLRRARAAQWCRDNTAWVSGAEQAQKCGGAAGIEESQSLPRKILLSPRL